MRLQTILVACIGRTVVAGTLALGLADVARATGWTAPMRVRSVDAATTSLDPPEVAMNQRGDAAVVWEESGVIQAAVRRAGAQFVVALPALSQPGAAGPKVGIDDAGNVTVAWTRGSVVQNAVQPAGGSFTGAQDMLDPVAGPVDLAVDGSGRAVEMYRGTTFNTAIKGYVRPADGSFGAAMNLISVTDVTSYESAMTTNARGDVVAVVDYHDLGSGFAALSWANGGESYLGFSSLFPFGRAHARVAVGTQGDAAVVWQQTSDMTGPHPLLRASIRPTGGTFTASPGIVIPGTGDGSEFPTVAVDAAGNVLVIWSEGAAGVMRSSFRPAGGDFGGPQDVPGTNGVTESRLVFSPDGTALAAFFQSDTIAASVRPPGGSFMPPTTLSSIDVFASDVRLAADDEGNVLAVWFESTADEYGVAGAFYDPVPPRLEELAVPATVRVGQAVEVSVSAVDRVGPVSVEWTFGDGGTATTAQASHTYATPGTFPVNVAATDAVGNQSKQTTAIVVSLCVSAEDCRTTLGAALPDPRTASTRPMRRAARRLTAIVRKMDALLKKASRTKGRKQARQYERAAGALDRLVGVARDADSQGSLGVPLAALEAAAVAVRAFIPAS
jgi:hypothetical protein